MQARHPWAACFAAAHVSLLDLQPKTAPPPRNEDSLGCEMPRLPCPQVGHVKDLGLDPAAHDVRVYQTKAAQVWLGRCAARCKCQPQATQFSVCCGCALRALQAKRVTCGCLGGAGRCASSGWLRPAEPALVAAPSVLLLPPAALARRHVRHCGAAVPAKGKDGRQQVGGPSHSAWRRTGRYLRAMGGASW